MRKTSMHLVLSLVHYFVFCTRASSLSLACCLGGASGGEFGSLMGGRKRERKEEAEVFKSIKISFLSRMVIVYTYYGDCVYPKTGRMLATKPTNIALLDEWGLIKNVLWVVRMLV